MLAHVVDAALKHDRGGARAATSGAAPYPQKSKSKVAALDALLIRAEADDDEDAAALDASSNSSLTRRRRPRGGATTN